MTDYRAKTVVLTLSGEYINLDAWQQKYGLPVGSDQIGKHFSLQESRFRRDIDEYGKLIVSEPLMIVADKVRELWGHPISFSSFNRNEKKQAELRADPATRHLRAETSPHVVKLAADADMATRADVLAFVQVLRQAADQVHVMIRIGYKEYLKQSEKVEAETGEKETWTFVHFDVCPEYYRKGRVWHGDPHPIPWEFEIVW
jgi:hypothetical protein